MNLADSEIVGSILTKAGYALIRNIDEADFILINTCAIRDNAEQRIRKRLRELRALQRQRTWVKIGILGCMAERLKTQLMEEEENVSFIVGPDAYRQLPDMLHHVNDGERMAETLLSDTETYADIEPVRYDTNGITAYISIMRGCQNYCAYCVVPYTRGRERSRNPETIVNEARSLFEKGFREVTLLGQNVNSYRWHDPAGDVGFPQLMAMVAQVNPLLRVRFATSHPKDLSDELLQVMADYDNICKCIHLPVQSGSERILKLMNRKYTREWYLERLHPRMVHGPHRRHSPLSAHMQHHYRRHRRILHRDRRGPPGHPRHVPPCALRLRLHVQVLHAPQHLCRKAPTR